ncbi:MAG: type II toxin-antitoxin system ParD family antitoxin [Candidatus Hydrogenedentes bacterium]|nr:type II toxin-antitoxin system ParD family antitoxin [Candidatus Hydrogenedentota bacterium]
MNVSLTPQLEAFVHKKVKSGQYHSANEVVRQALHLLKEHDRADKMRLEELRREIAIGVELADRGEVAPLDIEEIRATARKRVAPER